MYGENKVQIDRKNKLIKIIAGKQIEAFLYASSALLPSCVLLDDSEKYRKLRDDIERKIALETGCRFESEV